MPEQRSTRLSGRSAAVHWPGPRPPALPEPVLLKKASGAQALPQREGAATRRIADVCVFPTIPDTHERETGYKTSAYDGKKSLDSCQGGGDGRGLKTKKNNASRIFEMV